MYFLVLILLVPTVVSNMNGDEKEEDGKVPPGGGAAASEPGKEDLELPPPLKDGKELEIPPDFLAKMKSLSKRERRRTIFELSALLDEPDLAEEMEGVKKKQLQSTMIDTHGTHRPAAPTVPQATGPQSSDQHSITLHFDGSQADGNASHTVHLQSSNPPRLKTFSGKDPVPSGEVDFQTWWLKAQQLSMDEDITDSQKRKAVVDSLLKPALHTIRHIKEGPVQEILSMLKTAYGDVRSARTQLNAFYNMYPDDGQEASSYLMDLHNALMDLVNNGHMSVREVSKELVNQFVEAYDDDTYSDKLHLTVDMINPPSFGDLLLSIRTEESRRRGRQVRKKMSQREKDTTDKKKSSSSSSYEARISSMQATIDDLKRKKDEMSGAMAKQQQLLTAMQTQMSIQPSRTSSSSGTQQVSSTSSSSSCTRSSSDPQKPYPRFCHRCGKNGKHVASECRGEANPELVKKRMAEKKAHLNAQRL